AGAGRRGSHQRPEKRQTGGRSTGSAATTTGRGHATSTAAAMAAISAGVGWRALEGDIGVLALGQLFALGAQHVEAAAQHPASLGRVDDVVDIAPLGS